MSEPVISVKDVVVAFGDRVVLDHLSLDVQQGEVLGFVGGSGGGKTVLLRSIIGLQPFRSGRVEVFGMPLGADDVEPAKRADRRWGVLFQQGALFSSLTVIENVMLPMREFLKVSPRVMADVAAAKLAMVGLTAADRGKLPSELSGGMTKRAALARALALDPELLLLDEPTSGLDPIAAAEFDQLIVAMRETLGLTVFMITHDLESLVTICSRVGVLGRGKVVAQGTLAELQHSTEPMVAAYFQGHRAMALRRRAAGQTEGE